PGRRGPPGGPGAQLHHGRAGRRRGAGGRPGAGPGAREYRGDPDVRARRPVAAPGDPGLAAAGLRGTGVAVRSVRVAGPLARSLVRPLAGVARASDRLATGDLSARAEVAGPPEVRRAGAGLNRLALHIGQLLACERETVADLSHRLRTPLT